MNEICIGLDAIKDNVSKRKSYKNLYNNFIDIAAHISIKALVDKLKTGILTSEEAKEEYKTLAEQYEVFSKAYIQERKIRDQIIANSKKVPIELTKIANTRDKDVAFDAAISALRHITGDDLIGYQWLK